jgi:IclR family KDG regulon transcriptional repressor
LRNSNPIGAAADGAGARYQIDGVSNAARLLQAFTRESPRRRIADLAREVGITEALTVRTLETLARRDFVRMCDDDECELGFGWLSLADIRRRQVGVRQIAYPVMRVLRDFLNETIILSIRSGFRRISIENVESGQPIRRTAQSGFEVPLHIGSAGKVLLAGLAPGEIDTYLRTVPLRAFQGGAEISRQALMSEIENIRNVGYCIALREITSDAAAISAPVYDHQGETVAALSVSMPADRFSERLKKLCIRELLKAAGQLSKQLGRPQEPLR